MYKKIIQHLLNGDASDLVPETIRNINSHVVRFLNRTNLDPQEVEIVGDILHISNIIYNNTDRSILVLEDGVYDNLLQMYKRYNPNYQVGGEPVHFAPVGETVVKEAPQQRPVQLFQEMHYDKDMLFRKDIVSNNTYRRADFGGEDVKASKRLRNTAHNYPQLVGTLDKAKFTLNQEAVERNAWNNPNVVIFERDFLAKHIQEGIVDPNNISLVCELKYDGISVEADVTDEVVSARTRGDTGMDKATDLTSVFQGYPFMEAKEYAKKVGPIKQFGMKFEAIVDNFALQELDRKHNIRYVSSRNAVIGLTSRADARMYAHYITLVPLQTSLENMNRVEEIAFMNKFYANGIYLSHAVIHGNYQSVLYQVYKFVQEAEQMRDYIPFKYDGIVVSYIDPVIRTALGRKNFVNQFSIAIKFNTMKKLTQFIGYDYTVGKDGTITPMINYNPVEFFGGINTKSSGHSWKRFFELGLRKGDWLQAEFRNDVMVYIEKANVEENQYNPMPQEQFPSNCPCCGTKLVFSDKNAKCINLACPGRVLARVTDMLAKLGFKGFAEESVKKLELKGFDDLVNGMSEERIIKALGKADGQDFMEQLSKFLTDPQFDYIVLGSLGFTSIASTKWKGILQKVSLDELINLDNITLSTIMQSKPNKIGTKTIQTVLEERPIFINDLIAIKNLTNLVSIKDNKNGTTSKIIRFSGCRDVQLMMALNKLGHDCSEGSVTKNTNILLVPYMGFNSTKVASASKYNSNGAFIRILPIEEFRKNPNAFLQ